MPRPLISLLIALSLIATDGRAQSVKHLVHKADSLLTQKYQRNNFDTNYISRPESKLSITGRLNFSGATIRNEGIHEGMHFESKVDANYKATLSVGVNYAGVGMSLALNPAKLAGKYHDFELNLTKYGNRWGGEITYQDAKNFKGWFQADNYPRRDLSDELMKVRTLNVNFYYALNHRRFSYSAAFSQTYLQRRSAGSLLLAASYQGQWGDAESSEGYMKLRMNNIGIGCGYGHNFVPGKQWLLHISALPTFIVHSRSSANVNGQRVPIHYHFPEVIITGRGAVIKNFKRTFVGASMVFTFTNIGYRKDVSIENIKWHSRLFYGVRL